MIVATSKAKSKEAKSEEARQLISEIICLIADDQCPIDMRDSILRIIGSELSDEDKLRSIREVLAKFCLTFI